MVKPKIKASAVNSLTDARYFAARGVEWLGFRFGGSPTSSISPMEAKAISEWVDGVKIVGEFDFSDAKEIMEVNDFLHFDAVQVGMFTPVAEVEKLSGLTIFKEVILEPKSKEAEMLAHFEAFEHCATYFLLDFTKAGINWASLQALESLSMNFLKSLFAKYKVILAFDFQPENTREVLESLQPEGLSLTGGEEEKVGLKSFEELDEILDRLEAIE